MQDSAGLRFRQAMAEEKPLQLVGTINAYIAILAKAAGFRAIYLSGAGVANSSFGIPDQGTITLENVLEDVRRIMGASDLPLLVDVDTGFGDSSMISKTIKKMTDAGAAGVHIEDQISSKRCGHLAGKEIVPTAEMVERLTAAVRAKTDPHFIVMARTDAFSVDGIDGVIERSKAYQKAGADMLFPEALTDLAQYTAIKNAVDIPVLANITEFGKTPLFNRTELKNAGADIALYPLSANRSMNQAALEVFQTIRSEGTQKASLSSMQTREDLYKYLGYHSYEE
ncbi:MAG: methylisocitrate lyase [Candidatus Lindowbacteria bacterium]|nr:methylisocitrate lyase [Candidatus Lindowbacteria bacterium]